LTYSSILWVKIGTNIPDFVPQNRLLGGLWGPELKKIHDISIGSFGPTPRRPDGGCEGNAAGKALDLPPPPKNKSP
jgi:hypothetical protein